MLDYKLILEAIFTPKNIIIYLIIINLLAFAAMWWDKRRAQKGEWRISEAGLFTLVLLGGGIGGIVGMYTFRHKTKKLKFTIGFPTILITEIVLAIYFWKFMFKMNNLTKILKYNYNWFKTLT